MLKALIRTIVSKPTDEGDLGLSTVLGHGLPISEDCDALLVPRGSISDFGERWPFLVRLSGQGLGLRMLWKEAGGLLASRWLGWSGSVTDCPASNFSPCPSLRPPVTSPEPLQSLPKRSLPLALPCQAYFLETQT